VSDQVRLLVASACLIVAAMNLVWLASVRMRNAGIVDVFWGIGFALVALTGLALGDGYLGRRLLVAGVVTVWGLRLAVHLGQRNIGKPEDFRYARMRDRSPNFAAESLLKVFGVQAVAMLVVSLPVQVAQASGTPDRLTWRDALGVVLWLVGFAFEAIGDAQLRRFKADPGNAGSVMDRGLWRYTRHPNYFGDATMWWGLFVLALNARNGWWSIASPIVMTFLLARITGVPLLERRLMKTRPGYADYARRTSALIPLPPKRAPRGETT
jgi:steroid 5-alpha reductase family enzyme